MSELKKITVPREKVELEIGTVILMPFRFQYFSEMTEIINKYFAQGSKVAENYAAKRTEILDKYSDESLRVEALIALNESYQPGMEIAKEILKIGSEVAGDLKTVIEACLAPENQVVLDLDALTAIECLVLLGSALGLNINFFKDQMERMNLKVLFDDSTPLTEPKNPTAQTVTERQAPSGKPRAESRGVEGSRGGEKSSAA